jgi:hypothetical protein
VDTHERKKLIALYRDGYRAIVEVLHNITPEELDAKPGATRWSPRQIVHHLADSEMTAAVRLRVLVAQEHPTIQGYDQDQFAERLHYDRPHETSLEAFRWAREASAELLERLTPVEWLREGTHTEAGHYGVEAWLKTYADHAHKHARQIREARDAAAKVGQGRKG